MADYIPVHPGGAITQQTSSAVVGGQLVEVSGAQAVAAAGATSTKVLGVAAFDAAANVPVTVWIAPAVHETTAAAAITVGASLKAAAVGQVTGWTAGTDPADALLGTALTAAGSGAVVRWRAR